MPANPELGEAFLHSSMVDDPGTWSIGVTNLICRAGSVRWTSLLEDTRPYYDYKGAAV